MSMRHPHRHPQYVTHSQLTRELDAVNDRAAGLAAEVARQGNRISDLDMKVFRLEEAFLALAEEVAVLQTMVS